MIVAYLQDPTSVPNFLKICAHALGLVQREETGLGAPCFDTVTCVPRQIDLVSGTRGAGNLLDFVFIMFMYVYVDVFIMFIYVQVAVYLLCAFIIFVYLLVYLLCFCMYKSRLPSCQTSF